MPTVVFRTVKFDEQLNPSGIGSLDLALRIRRQFPKTIFVEAKDVLFYHFQSKARNKMANKLALEHASATKFYEKWGNINLESAYHELERPIV